MIAIWHTLLRLLGSFRVQALVGGGALALCFGLFGVWYFLIRKQPPTCSGDFDLVVVGAEIIDGLGGPPYKSDIGIRNKRIACIGTADPTQARQVIDGNGLEVAPGFIDVHTHVERNVPTSAAPFLARNFIRQGVTTIVTGNCGRSFLDLGKAFRLLERNGAQVNVASLVGHNTIRLHVMKESARAPTRTQMNEMKALVRAAMRDGAIGLSTGLEYIPGAFSKTDEIMDLARTVKEANGLYASHIRNEGTNGAAAIREVLSIGRSTQIHVHISHFKAQGPNQWGSARTRLNLIKSAQQEGVVASLDQYPYTASSTSIAVLVPSWISEGGQGAMRQKLSDPATRKQLRTEMLDQLRSSGWKDYSFARVSYCGFNHTLVGLTIPEIAQTRGEVQPVKGPTKFTQTRFDRTRIANSLDSKSDLERQADTVIELFSHGDAQMVFFNMSDDDVETIMKDPEVMFGSDSGVREESSVALPHPRGLGTFPRILGRYARDAQLFSMEGAVRRMTSLPARTFGLSDRGVIRQGYWADLVIFDRNNIIDTATYEKPLNNPAGVYYVIVNGSIALDPSGITRALPGMVIRKSDQVSRTTQGRLSKDINAKQRG
jgi:N-acyl-D-amino-acid deacylase